jgi:D-aminopeptidase
MAHHGSGEIFLAFSNTARVAYEERRTRVDVTTVPDSLLDDVFAATVEATEEAVLNALWAAVDTPGRGGRVARALPHEATLGLLERHGRIGRA